MRLAKPPSRGLQVRAAPLRLGSLRPPLDAAGRDSSAQGQVSVILSKLKATNYCRPIVGARWPGRDSPNGLRGEKGGRAVQEVTWYWEGTGDVAGRKMAVLDR
ncbi:hypothetical protein E2C01_064424 [Portunus trituberculatus]|uniref:Uncharacterized protein n=1 Tax=Portunus trituberculatus TaxID=210409 RepID=A0A5B7HJ18_PORTR|nr:hypothetical protein [Portunus trituberculatus]